MSAGYFLGLLMVHCGYVKEEPYPIDDNMKGSAFVSKTHTQGNRFGPRGGPSPYIPLLKTPRNLATSFCTFNKSTSLMSGPFRTLHRTFEQARTVTSSRQPPCGGD